MSHSVARHLHIDLAAYDRTVRQFIPGYEELITHAVETVATSHPSLVLDLGAGTGALAERLLERTTETVVELWDVDAAMLGIARERLTRFGQRARFRVRSFDDSFPAADAMMASLAFHHVRDLGAKEHLYRRIAQALRPAGVLAFADVVLPADPADREAAYRDWAARMAGLGIPEENAWRHFDEWSQEDRYFSLEEETGALTRAGLQAQCVWQHGPGCVLAAWKR